MTTDDAMETIENARGDLANTGIHAYHDVYVTLFEYPLLLI